MGMIGIFLSILAVGAYHVQQGSAQDVKPKMTIDKAFPHSSKCKRCHERVFEEWETSPLSRSIHTPTFRAALDQYVTVSGGKDKALCFRCHAPHVREFPDQADMFVARHGRESHRWMASPACNAI